jgi:ADP-heptose:LPS heptosyltransferase
MAAMVRAPRRLGILRLSAIGDVVHALPLAMGLRRAFPEARITWVVQAHAAPLLENHPAVDDILVYPRRGGPGVWARFLADLRGRRFDATVDPQGNVKSGVIGLLSGARFRAGLHARDCKERLNALLTNRHGRRPVTPHGVDRAWTAAGPLGVTPGRRRRRSRPGARAAAKPGRTRTARCWRSTSPTRTTRGPGFPSPGRSSRGWPRTPDIR